MKKILAFVAIAAASAALFAADTLPLKINKGFQLVTKVKGVDPVFHLYKDTTVVDNHTFTDGDDGVAIDLLKNGSFTGVDVGFEAGANFAADAHYKVTAEDTGFYLVGNTSKKAGTVTTTVKVATATGADGATSTVTAGYYGTVTKLANSAITVSWTGDSTLPAASYEDDVTVTIATN